MKEITIKASHRKRDNRKWVNIFDCFDSHLFHNKDSQSQNNTFSLKEVSIKPNMGFVPHYHKNTDYIMIPVQGCLFQKNNLGQSFLTKKGEIHIMSSGSGITHFEYNRSKTELLNCIIFEILPDELNKPPESRNISLNAPLNQLENMTPVDNPKMQQTLVKNVNAFCGHFQKGFDFTFNPTSSSSQILFYVVEGSVNANGRLLTSKDTMGIYNELNLNLEIEKPSQILLFEIINPSKQLIN